MKQIASIIVLIAVVVSLGVGGTLADWVDRDHGNYHFQVGEWEVGRDGTIGFWRGPGALNAFDPLAEDTIEFWLGEIDTASDWLGPTTYEDAISEDWLYYGGPDMYMKFRAQYLAQWLNQISGRQSESTLHNVMDVPGYAASGNYLGLGDPYYAPGWEIVDAIEDTYSEPFPDFELMKDICDYLNNLWI